MVPDKSRHVIMIDVKWYDHTKLIVALSELYPFIWVLEVFTYFDAYVEHQ